MTDIEAMTQLEILRKRERSATKAGLVEAVMVQPVSFEEKLKRIEMIDRIPEDEPPKKAPRVKREPKEEPPAPTEVFRSPAPLAPAAPAAPLPAVDPTLNEFSRVEHYRRRLAKPPVIGGLWRYLTKEYGAIIRFGARTSTISRGIFPFTLKLSDEVLAFLGKTLPQQVLPVLDQTLPLLLRKSWVHLSKYEYNLLVGLRDLVAAARGVIVSDGDKTAGGLAWDAVLPAMRLFWTQPDLLAKTLAAWDTATQRLSSADKSRQAGADSIRTLLEARIDTLSLPDALLALLMIRARRMVSWDEGKVTEPGEYFARDGFECPPDIQAEIDKAADVLVGQLEVLAREGQEVRRIRYYLPSEDLLTPFTGGADQTDLTLWCQILLKNALTAWAPLLEGSVTFADGTQTQLFDNPTLSATLGRLRLIEGQAADAGAAKNAELIPSAARVLMNLGKTLVVVIRNRSATAHPLARSEDTVPSDPLPFETNVLDLPLEWAGVTVIDALIKTARICLQAGRRLGETSLDASLEKEGTLPARTSELMARVARLVPQARLDELRNRYSL